MSKILEMHSRLQFYSSTTMLLNAALTAKGKRDGELRNLAIFQGLAKIQEVTVSISDEWRMVILG